ncbi:MAG: hypothetical protein U0V70_05805 [Terriglobia bacterium]
MLEYISLREIASLSCPHLRYPVWRPKIPDKIRRAERSMFDAMQASDILVHHPYESFDGTILRFLEEAREDPSVLAIKMTIYRAGHSSPFIPLLIRAGCSQSCLPGRAKARFDEQENTY